MPTGAPLRALLFPALLSAAVAACSSTAEDTGEDRGAVGSILDDDTPLVPNGRDEAIRVPADGTMLTELAQPELLVQLQKDGYHFGLAVGESTRSTNADLFGRSEVYKSLAGAIEADLDALADANPSATTRVVQNTPRLFDKRWLTSPYASFDLVDVVNRIDRKDFGSGACGETRFVYRLSYVKGESRVPTFSRLPFFFNVVFENTATDCAERARAWKVPSGLSSDEFVRWLERGALARGELRLKQIELNAQVLRTPSESKTDMGGLARYFLRVYTVDGNAVIPAPLENTPDVARLERDSALRAELLDWIKSNVESIDEGTAVMPEKFAANKVDSFTTFGSVRTRNKPFSQLFRPSDLAGVDFASTKVVASSEALLFRLDDMTCAGCHQGRSVAGFHVLGAERGTRTHPLNALRVHASPHLHAELARREGYLEKLAANETPDAVRGLAIDPPPGATAKVGNHCILQADRGHFKRTFDCAPGSSCTSLVTSSRSAIDLGVCMPDEGGFAGLPCLGGTMTDGDSPSTDRLRTTNLGCKGGYSCLKPVEGTPAGMCVASCKGRLGDMHGANEICAFGGGAQFDVCAASANFASCIGSAVRPAPRQACDEDTPCREDYMCQRLEPITGRATISTTPRTKGFCNPTYFIFQMRLDGHPSPI